MVGQRAGGAAAPRFTTSGSTTTASFALAGKYTLVVTQTDAAKNSVAESIIVNVGQTPAGTITGSTLTVTGVSQVLPNATFVDQFGKPITSATTYAWTAATLPAALGADLRHRCQRHDSNLQPGGHLRAEGPA